MQFVGGSSLQRIDVDFQIVLKEAPEVLQNAARQFRVILFVEQLIHTRNAHDDPDAFTRSPGEISGQPIIFEIVGDEHGHATGAEDLRAPEKITTINLFAASKQIAHGQFH